LERRNRWMGWYVSSGALASLLWIELAGLIAHYDWRFTFFLYAIGLVILTSAAIALKSGDEQVESSPDRIEPARPSWAVAVSLLPLVWIGLASGAVENTTLLFLPFHLVEIGETLPSRIAAAALPITLGITVAALFYGQVRRHLSISAIYTVCFLTAGLTLLWLGTAQSYAIIMVAVSILGFGLGLLAPNLYAFAAVYGSEEHRARNIGIARGSFFIGSPLVQFLLEPVSRFGGNGMALFGLGCVALILMLWVVMFGQRLFAVST
jgi:MFS transporter, ACDE family, multidrug resistance protein